MEAELNPERWRVLNIQRCADAMDVLYKTYIVDQAVVATARGEAIQAINRMILGLGGEDMISKIEAVPWSARMRESGEPELVKLAEDVKNASSWKWRGPPSKPNIGNDGDQQ